MSEQIFISVIIPVYNAEKYIKNCLNSLLLQDFQKPFEIIMIDDGSTDNSLSKINSFKVPLLRLLSLPSNTGQSAARNLGIKNAKGKYIFLMDADDEIAKNTLSTLYNVADNNNCDLVFCDFIRIENSENQRSNTFSYKTDKFFERKEIVEALEQELYNHNPVFGHLGLLGCNGRLIKTSILHDNNILFSEELRYLEDKDFGWNILGFVKSVRYIRNQLYTYYVYPNTTTTIIDGIHSNFPISNFKLIKKHIENTLKLHNLSSDKIIKLSEQGFIFFIITLLVAFSRRIILKKTNIKNTKNTKNYLREIINQIISDKDVESAVKNYIPSEKESFLIPKFIKYKLPFFLQLSLILRSKKTLKDRRKNNT